MRLRFAFGMAVALLASTAAVFAYPSLNASTGLIGVPNAGIAPSGSFTGAADVLFLDDAVLNARAIVGFSPRFEGGAAVVFGDDTGLAVNGKYNLAANIGGFAASLGATYITSDNSGSGWQAYLVGTRTLTRPTTTSALNGTLGITFTDIEDLSAVRPFVGAQWLLSSRTELGAEFEFEAGDFDESISSIYLRQNMGDSWSGQIGFTNANGFVGTEDHDFFLGLAYAFPGGR